MSVRDHLLLTPVALLLDVPDKSLARGQVGTIVETLAEGTVLVEFSDDSGRAYALAACEIDSLLPLRMAPLAA